MRLWLDDIRPAPPGFDVHVKTAQDAIRLLKSGKVSEVSLDHDLGEGSDVGIDVGTGYDVAVWIERQAFDGTVPRIVWNVHSANPVGRRRMELALQNADKFWDANASKKEASMSTKPPKMIKVGNHIYKLAMDPEVALRKVQELANSIVDDENESDAAVEMAGYFLGLDEWLQRGGFLPKIWERSEGEK